MNISTLLTSGEIQCFKNQVSYGTTINLACVARLYTVKDHRWVKSSSGVVTLEENSSLKHMSISFYNLIVSL